MTWHQPWYQLLTLVISVVQVNSDAMLSNIAALVHDSVQDPIINNIQLQGLHGPIPTLQEQQMPPFLNQQMAAHMAMKMPAFNGPNVPLDILLASERTNMSPPVSPSNYLTLPQFPIGFVDFQVNQSKHRFATSKHQSGYISIPPGAPVNFLQVPDWKSYMQAQGGMPPGRKMPTSPHKHALGLVVQGPVLEGKPSDIQVDPVHHLSMNHLFVPIPVAQVNSKGGNPGNQGKIIIRYMVI
jgi:hypothetical protein